MTMQNKLNLGKALITGASTGIGAVYADRLAKRGYDLILVARDVARLNALAARLTSETGRKMEVVGADLTKRTDLSRVEEILKTDSKIQLLVNNAGIAMEKAFAESNGDELERLIALNITALVRLSNAVVPGFVQRKAGCLVNLSSVVALMPGQFNANYGASKAFVLNFSRTLAEELKAHGVHVQAVLPGATKTEIWERSGMDLDALPKALVMSAEDMVDASLVGLDRREIVTIPALPDAAAWEAMESARVAMLPGLSRAKPGARYLKTDSL